MDDDFSIIMSVSLVVLVVLCGVLLVTATTQAPGGPKVIRGGLPMPLVSATNVEVVEFITNKYELSYSEALLLVEPYKAQYTHFYVLDKGNIIAIRINNGSAND